MWMHILGCVVLIEQVIFVTGVSTPDTTFLGLWVDYFSETKILGSIALSNALSRLNTEINSTIVDQERTKYWSELSTLPKTRTIC
jgi:hypothetical protein